MTSEENRFWKDVYIASISGLLKGRGNWKTNGKPVNSTSEWSAVASEFADHAVDNLRAAKRGQKK